MHYTLYITTKYIILIQLASYINIIHYHKIHYTISIIHYTLYITTKYIIHYHKGNKYLLLME